MALPNNIEGGFARLLHNENGRESGYSPDGRPIIQTIMEEVFSPFIRPDGKAMSREEYLAIRAKEHKLARERRKNKGQGCKAKVTKPVERKAWNGAKQACLPDPYKGARITAPIATGLQAAFKWKGKGKAMSNAGLQPDQEVFNRRKT